MGMETISDIVAEMRDATMNGEYDDATVDAWADRIEAANRQYRTLEVQNERLKQRLVLCEKINEQQDIDNARLRAALQSLRKRLGYEPAEVDIVAAACRRGDRPVEFRTKR